MQQQVRISAIKKITHDVLQIRTEKPPGLAFVPGQATELSINKEGWLEERRPFTFTSLPQEEQLEFTIKTYPSHEGVTAQLLELEPGDSLLLHDVFGAIAYKGEGVFIAGGAGVTPFISIFRHLKARGEVGSNKLIFANNTSSDIILEEEFRSLLNGNFINILSQEESADYLSGYITRDLLKEQLPETNPYLYLCGPPPMMEAVEQQLKELNVDKERLVTEEF